MKKVLDLLEKNVQWLALGLGAVYVLWMAYTYVLQKPVSVEIGQEMFSPGTVDDQIASTVVEELQMKMNDTRVPQMSAPQYVAMFKQEMAYEGAPQLALATPVFRLIPNEPPQIGVAPGPRPRPGVGPVAAVVEKLVVPPAVQMLDTRVGNSKVSMKAPTAAQPGPEVARGGAEEDRFNPGGAQPPAMQAPAQPVVDDAGVEKSWVTVKYQISMNELAKAFSDTKVPWDLRTVFLDASLVRQEMQPDGTWTADTTIKRLSINQIPPMPGAGAKVRDYENYLAWARDHVQDILQPPFYTVIKGDAWAVPGEELTPQVAQPQPGGEQDRPFNPADWVNATLDDIKKAGLTAEQRQLIAKYKADKKKEEQKGRGGSKGSGPGGRGGRGGMGGGGGGMGGPGGAFGPNDGGRGSTAGEGGLPSDLPPPYPGPYGPGEGMPYPYPTPQQQVARPVYTYPLPTGEFDPRNPTGGADGAQGAAMDNIVGWAHDDTVQPGRVYRYRVVYKIKSPIWNRTDVAKDPKLAETFALASKPGEWTDEIHVPSLTNFFVLQADHEKGTAKVVVFRRQEGELQKKEFTVTPGDVIGTIDSTSGVDFTTGWTMVDARQDIRGTSQYAILMDPDGRLHRRDWREDQASPEYQKAQQQLASAAGTTPTPPPGASDRVAGGSER